MRILVTNDDGVFAPGIGVMTDALIEAGHDVMVVAPLENHSGSSAATVLRHSIGAVSFKAVKLSAAPGVRAIGVRALPSVCVSLALAGAFGPPADLVVSGINRGPNVGRFILHSGTVGAALTAAQQGRSAIAVGLRGRWTATMHYETAAAVAVALVEPLASMRAGTVLNCNVPDLELDMLRGVRRAELNMADVFHVERTGSRRVRVSFGFPGHADGGRRRLGARRGRLRDADGDHLPGSRSRPSGPSGRRDDRCAARRPLRTPRNRPAKRRRRHSAGAPAHHPTTPGWHPSAIGWRSSAPYIPCELVKRLQSPKPA